MRSRKEDYYRRLRKGIRKGDKEKRIRKGNQKEDQERKSKRGSGKEIKKGLQGSEVCTIFNSDCMVLRSALF